MATSAQVAVLCAVNWLPAGAANLLSLAKLFDGNPYEEVWPPAASEPREK